MTLHFANGYVTGELTNGEGMAGGIGAVVGEQTGEYLRGNTNFSKNTGVTIAGLTGALAGGLTSQNAEGVFAGQQGGLNSAMWNAYFAKRPLEGVKWHDNLSHDDDSLNNDMNVEISHEQLFYEDEEGGNVGFFATEGWFGGGETRADNDNVLNQYRITNRGYDDTIMRQAVQNVEHGVYNLCTNNCQTYSENLRTEYRRLYNVQHPSSKPNFLQFLNYNLQFNQNTNVSIAN